MKLEDVARIAGVSRSTVSRVLNEDRRVSGAVRARVLEVIADTNYHPNAAARTLVTRRTGNVGLVFPKAFASMFSDPWSSQLIHGCLDGSEAADLSLMLMLGATEDDASMATFFERLIRGRHLDGIVLGSHHRDDALIARLIGGDFPYVLVGHDADNRAHFVDIDNRAAARKATEHLIGHGYRSIATITGPDFLVTAQDRLEGFMDAMEAAALEPHSRHPLTGGFIERDGHLAARELLGTPGQPDAIFAANDAMAIGTMRAARERGLRIPDDLALVGFDDVDTNRVFHTDLTTIRQPTEELGRDAIAMLATLIADMPTEPRQQWVDADLVIRGSCGCPTSEQGLNAHLDGKEEPAYAAPASLITPD